MGIELHEINDKEYKELTGNKCYSYCRAEFQLLNAYKVEKVLFFVGKDKKNRLALSVGEEKSTWNVPFSAPFGSFIELQSYVELSYYWEMVKEVINEAKKRGINTINFMLPPDIYNAQVNSKTINALMGNGFRNVYQEVNYSFDLKSIKVEDYANTIRHNARKNLKKAIKDNLTIIKCEKEEEKEKAYEIIRINRDSHNYPLAMSWDQVIKTGEVIQQDYYLVVKKASVCIASAIVFEVDDSTIQVVYWGDLRDEGNSRPINFLAYELIKQYKKLEYSTLDIGPSSLEGIPNLGLCDFKESIGCNVSSKYKFRWTR